MNNSLPASVLEFHLWCAPGIAWVSGSGSTVCIRSVTIKCTEAGKSNQELKMNKHEEKGYKKSLKHDRHWVR